MSYLVAMCRVPNHPLYKQTEKGMEISFTFRDVISSAYPYQSGTDGPICLSETMLQ